MNYLISGATGFVGTHLLNHLGGRRHGTEVISRRPNVGCDWTMESLLPAVLQADVVVHLAGAGVMDAAWSPARKLELESSRVETTALLAQACVESSRQGHTPRLVSASATRLSESRSGRRGGRELRARTAPTARSEGGGRRARMGGG